MNGEPHTHQPDIRVDGDGDIRVQYGDQRQHYVMTCWPGWRSRVTRVLRRQIRHHDRYSQKAYRKVIKVHTLRKEINLTEREGYWGNEILKKKGF